MKNKFNNLMILSLIIFNSMIITSCSNTWSRIEKDDKAGYNGSFEIIRNGIPVNWYFSTPDTNKNKFNIIIDSTISKDGKNSLKFDVKKCSVESGVNGPGFFEEFFNTIPGETYKVSFWLKNQDSEYLIKVRAVKAYGGNPEEVEQVLQSKENLNEWTYYEFDHKVPNDMWLRFEMNILKPGSFWIDDLRITLMNKK